VAGLGALSNPLGGSGDRLDLFSGSRHCSLVLLRSVGDALCTNYFNFLYAEEAKDRLEIS
jgi:hypothetical protein